MNHRNSKLIGYINVHVSDESIRFAISVIVHYETSLIGKSMLVPHSPYADSQHRVGMFARGL